ncbi:hypothetical protein H6A15_10320, partial [Enorma phocaeensis]|nr:hypothetical protein [Enorma phocaeensis]
MTDAQVAAVRARDLDRRVEKANFPYVKTLADFDFSFQPESPPFPLTLRVPFGHDAVNGERGHGMGHPSPKYSAEF